MRTRVLHHIQRWHQLLSSWRRGGIHSTRNIRERIRTIRSTDPGTDTRRSEPCRISSLLRLDQSLLDVQVTFFFLLRDGQGDHRDDMNDSLRRIWKAFMVWYKNIRVKKVTQASKALTNNLFLLQDVNARRSPTIIPYTVHL